MPREVHEANEGETAHGRDNTSHRTERPELRRDELGHDDLRAEDEDRSGGTTGRTLGVQSDAPTERV